MPTDPLPDSQALPDSADPSGADAESLLDGTPAEAMPAPFPSQTSPAMRRPLVAAGAAALAAAMITGWALGRAGAPLPSPSAPARAQAAEAAASPSSAETLPLPVVDAERKERNRFTRADRDDDGLVQQSEYLSLRRRNYDKLDANHDGHLEFGEYAAAGIAKFAAADGDRSGTLDASEYAATAPKRRAKRAAPCASAPDADA